METAKEELEILQAQYPNRFAYLKSDLQSFISNIREDHAPPSGASSSPLVLTQGTCTIFVDAVIACCVVSIWTDDKVWLERKCFLNFSKKKEMLLK